MSPSKLLFPDLGAAFGGVPPEVPAALNNPSLPTLQPDDAELVPDAIEVPAATRASAGGEASGEIETGLGWSVQGDEDGEWVPGGELENTRTVRVSVRVDTRVTHRQASMPW